MTLALIAITISALALIFAILRDVIKGTAQGGVTVGKFDGEVRNLKDDVQGLHKSISILNDMQNRRYHDFYKEFVALKVKVAAYTKNANGG